jgi:hypothetical protein
MNQIKGQGLFEIEVLDFPCVFISLMIWVIFEGKSVISLSKLLLKMILVIILRTSESFEK